MLQKKFGYSIHGYRYAPESFRAYHKTQGGHEIEIPLYGEQCRELGNLYLTQGDKAAFDYVKRIDRERTRRCRLYMTYGFLTQEDPHTYLFIKQLRFREGVPLNKRLEMFRELKNYLVQTGGKVKTGDKCRLDGYYRPVDVKELYLTVDFGHSVIIRLEIV
jgi:hypothetical protein